MEVSTSPNFPTAYEKGLKPWQRIQITNNLTVIEAAYAASGEPVLGTILFRDDFAVLVALDCPGMEVVDGGARLCFPVDVEPVAGAPFPHWLPFCTWSQLYTDRLGCALDLMLTTGEEVCNCWPKSLNGRDLDSFLELSHPYRRIWKSEIAAVRPTQS